jgi:hypothetical protein
MLADGLNEGRDRRFRRLDRDVKTQLFGGLAGDGSDNGDRGPS